MAFATSAALPTRAQSRYVGAFGYVCPTRNVSKCGSRARSAPGKLRMGLFDMFGNKEAAQWGLQAGFAAYPAVGKDRGEDAFFIEGNAIGVFDGVGSAAKSDEQAGAYSQFLAVNTSSEVRFRGMDKISIALNEAAELNREVGASTACVGAVDKYGRLIGVNLGDSGVMVIRDGKMVYKSKEQVHFFNCPFQLGSDSDDTVAMGKNIRTQLREGDWLVFATDGLWDNVYAADIIKTLQETIEEEGIAPTAIADNLARLALEKSALEAYTSPFAKEAEKNKIKHRGGKLDDVTVVAALVSSSVPEPLSIVSA